MKCPKTKLKLVIQGFPSDPELFYGGLNLSATRGSRMGFVAKFGFDWCLKIYPPKIQQSW